LTWYLPTPVSSTTAAMHSSPCLPTLGHLAATPRLFKNVIAWKFRNRIESKPMK
jgi:hypothetical protein